MLWQNVLAIELAFVKNPQAVNARVPHSFLKPVSPLTSRL